MHAGPRRPILGGNLIGGESVQRQPWSQSRFAGIFGSAEGGRRYTEQHAAWARKAGAVFAWRLRELERSPRRMLDVGSGSGDMAVVLAAEFPDARITGLDLSEHMVAIARERVAAAGLSERVSFTQGDAARLPFEDGAFDTVVSQDTLHLLDDPLPMLTECWRVLAPDGALVLRSVRRSWLGLLDPIFRTGYSAQELIGLAERAGLKGARVIGSLMYLMLEWTGGA